MISSKKSLDSADEGSGDGYEAEQSSILPAAIQGYRSALREMGCCSMIALPALGAELKHSLGKLEESLSGKTNSLAIATTQRDAQQHLQKWGRLAAEYNLQKARDVRELSILLANTIDSFGERDRLCAEQLNNITNQLERIASLDDPAELRDSIQIIVKKLNASVERILADGIQAITQLRTQVALHQAKLELAEEIAFRDPMTGLRNRPWIENQMECRVGSGVPFCIAFVDIVGFKKVNDDHGHLVGDELLRQFAAELHFANRSTDVIGRWGGDEFILVLDCGSAEAPAQIDRLCVSVCKNYMVQARDGPRKVAVNASIGLVQHILGETIMELVARADAAMYAHKAECRETETGAKLQHSTLEQTSPPPQMDTKQGSTKMKSLVAEDDVTNRKLLQTFLSRFGQCDIAVDGKEAVRAVRLERENHQSYDLVCMDLRMPEMDGQEAIGEIRKQEAFDGVARPAKIIVTTAHTDMEDVVGALLGRCNAYLVKPIDTAKLRKELKSLGLIQ